MKIFLSLGLLVAATLAEPPSYRQQSQADRTYYFAKQQEAEQAQGDAPYPASGWRPDGPSFDLPQRQQQQVANQYGAPAAPQSQYGAPAAPQNQYGAPAQQNRYVPSEYGAPAKQTAAPQPQRQYGAPQKQLAQPQRQYGAPAKLQSQYGAPAAPQNQNGTPPRQYGAPSGTTDAPDYEDTTTTPAGTESQAEPVNAVNELDEEGEVDAQQRQAGEYYVALPDGRLQRVQYVSSQDIAAMKYFAKIRAENVEPLRGAVYAYQPLQKLEFAPARLQVVNEPVVAAPVVEVREKSQKIQKSEPLAAELAAPVVAPVSSSYTTYTANYQVPEQRYLVTF